MDRRARAELPKAPPVVTTRHGARELRKDGFTTFALRTWETQAVTKGDATLRITSMPGVHSTNPVLKAALPPVMGSMLELEATPGVVSRRVYITGDTMPHLDLRQIATRYPDIDLALLHLGGTQILGMTVTMTGEHGAKLARLLAPTEAAAIHYDDYPVFKSPLADFRAAVERIGLPRTTAVYLERGETHSFG
jgi:L-ascorbate metabolism protein UlaG (beta-lactamase superfamily)